MPADPAAEPARGGLAGLVAAAPLAVVRVLQFAIDLTLVALQCLIPLAVILILPRNPDGSLAVLVAAPVVLLLLAACTAISWWHLAGRPRRDGQSRAMRWLGLRVVDAAGAQASGLQLSLRWVMLLADGMLLGAVGVVSMLLTPRTQRLGDLVADTLVVRVGPQGRAERRAARPDDAAPSSEVPPTT